MQVFSGKNLQMSIFFCNFVPNCKEQHSLLYLQKMNMENKIVLT